jgi:lipopolysaccharide assembly outer membrane protein LptD (OstA)
MVALGLFIPFVVYAQEESGPLLLEHADQLVSVGAEGDIVNLIGNVHFAHENANLYSHTATWYRRQGFIQFVDSVLVTDDSRRISARSMTYFRLDKKVTAQDDVILEDAKQGVILFCQKADYFRGTKQFNASGHPLLIMNPQDDSSRMQITALHLEYSAQDAQGEAYDSVVITRVDMTAMGQQANFYKNPESAVLTGNPEIIQKENQLTGDTISIFTDNRRIQRLLIERNARAVYTAQPDTLLKEYTTAELTGKELEAYFTNDKIDQVVTRYNATSTYIPAVTDTVTTGTNIASGDSITLFFKEGTVRRVFISGGAQGEFIEPKFTSEGKPYPDTTRYAANGIDYRFEDSQIKLIDNGSLRYHDMALDAGDIRYNTSTRILIAQGIPVDTAGGQAGSPVLRQGSEELHGDRMSYNLATKRGQVRVARTKYEGGFYTGQQLRQASRDIIFVSQGDYTSCDLPEDPHYHFHSNRMKMIGKDKVVAKPVFLYIGDLPVFAVPYYVFPIRKGRHSGFLPFNIGNLERGNRFIRNLGYYWAASDYWDAAASLDFYESASTTLNTDLNYVWRYRLTGNVGINYTRQASWSNYRQSIRNRWLVRFSHNQTISPSVSLYGYGSFVSDKNYIADNIYDPTQRLDRTITSKGSFSKKWKSSSLVVTATQNWNLDTDNKSALLPSISFSRSSLPIFAEPGKIKKKERIRPGEMVKIPRKRFYHSIYFSISSVGQNIRNRFRNPDSTFTQKNYQTIDTRGGLSSPQKILGFLTVTPAVNATLTIYRLEPSVIIDRQGAENIVSSDLPVGIDRNPGGTPDSLLLKTNRFYTRETYNLNLTTSTTIYGAVFPKMFGITGLRHVVTPSATYTFTPEIRKNQQYAGYTGVGGFSRRSRVLSYSVGNLFQARYRSGDLEKKLDLFTLNFSSGYNFTALQHKYGDISTSLRTSSIPHVDFTLAATHSFYNADLSRRSLLKPRLTNMSIATGIKFGYHPGNEEKKGDSGNMLPKSLFSSGAGKAQQFSNIGFDVTISHQYGIAKMVGLTSKMQWFDFSTQFQPTKNWVISYNCRYNMITKRIENQEFDIGRDMHCWSGSFTWRPTEPLKGYYVRISIKSLPDIKVEQSQGGLGGRGLY